MCITAIIHGATEARATYTCLAGARQKQMVASPLLLTKQTNIIKQNIQANSLFLVASV
jgi:hypothetical protein